MAKIKNCFMDDQPEFYFKAEIDGIDYGMMRHLTDDDFSFIRKYSDRKPITDKDGNPVMLERKVKDKNGKIQTVEEPQYDYDALKLMQGYILCAFGGTDPYGYSHKLGQEGWTLDRDCTIDNIKLLKPNVKAQLHELILKKAAEFSEQKEAIEKN